MSSANEIKEVDMYCAVCRVRQWRIDCARCNKQLCKVCNVSSRHNCNSMLVVELDQNEKQMLNRIMHDYHNMEIEQKEDRERGAAINLKVEENLIEVEDKLNQYIQKEEELISNYYKTQYEKQQRFAEELTNDNNKLKQQLIELEREYKSNIDKLSQTAEYYKKILDDSKTETKEYSDRIAEMEQRIKDLTEQKINSPRGRTSAATKATIRTTAAPTKKKSTIIK